VPVLLRAAGDSAWIEAMTENVSASGLLLRTTSHMAVGTSMELMLEMPREITARMATRVLCRGSVVRTSRVAADGNHGTDTFLLACSISDYSYVNGTKDIAS
jgi:hypothetical protein